MARIEIRQFIRATPEAIWAIVSDLSGQERWMEDVREMEITSEVRSGAGTPSAFTPTATAGVSAGTYLLPGSIIQGRLLRLGAVINW